jgi:ectoine hydroxylase-related dioxygenase (phytanoyl-CoA dioxygenase family)
MLMRAKIDARSGPGWVAAAVATMQADGFTVIAGMLTPEQVETYREAVFRLRAKTIATVGEERFEQAVASGHTELRLPFLLEPVFFDLLADPKVLAMVDAVLGPAAILRFLNAMITPPESGEPTARLTDQFHQNFKMALNAGQGTPVFAEVAFPLTSPAQAFKILPGSHGLPTPPDAARLEKDAIDLQWEPGDAMLMTPFVWHREQHNVSGADALSIFAQFARPFIKPHADYVRAIGPEALAQLPERTQRLLGSHSQLPVSFADFYLPADQLPYRPGQW